MGLEITTDRERTQNETQKSTLSQEEANKK